MVDTEHEEHEALVKYLNDETCLREYKESCDNHPVSLIPKLLGGLLVSAGNLFYGNKPSYLKFRAVEVIARVPYHSWAAVAHTLLTAFYQNEQKALDLCGDNNFARLSQENETMHVVVISYLVKKEGIKDNVILHTVIPMLFAFFYYWMSYIMYMIRPKWSLELNYLFENHAFEQYDQFIDENEEMLKDRSIESEFLSWYGREHLTQYDFFKAVRNDELIHRNKSIHAIPQPE